jgi:hypothetical protein
MDLKEIKINFKNHEKSEKNFIIPNGKYELKYITNDSNMNKKDDFILNEGDKFIILKFSWTDDDDINSDNQAYNSNSISTNKNKKIFKILNFIMCVEYLRTEPINIEYEMEIKFRIKLN